MQIQFTLNGEAITAEALAGTSLLNMLRDSFGLTGTKAGCEIGECGACSVLVDGVLVNSCLTLAPQVDGSEVLTIEGVHAPDGGPSAVQQALLKHGTTQCGFCIPGIVIAAEALLMHNPSPDEQEIKEALAGNLCRCTGYKQVIEAIAEAAKQRLTEHTPEVASS